MAQEKELMRVFAACICGLTDCPKLVSFDLAQPDSYLLFRSIVSLAFSRVKHQQH
jgi:hypothetical protein